MLEIRFHFFLVGCLPIIDNSSYPCSETDSFSSRPGRTNDESEGRYCFPEDMKIN